jgi:hypothetical protein
MEMKQSKMAQYLAGTLDMEDTKNKNSLYIELAEKLSYGNRDDISTALAVTSKVTELTGKEPEFEPYVAGLPKRSLGQDIRSGYITPSEEAQKMHRDLKGEDLPGIGNPSAHEIACTDAEIGARAAGFQTGHPISSMQKMLLDGEKDSVGSTGSKPFDQEGQDMTFGPSKVIKGALSNNMEEVVEGLKETNSIGASKDLENSLSALSSPGGIAKFLVDTMQQAVTASPSDIAKNATNLYKSVSDYSKDRIQDSKEQGGIASQLVEQLQMLTAQPTKVLGNIADAYEKGLASQTEQMMKSLTGVTNPNERGLATQAEQMKKSLTGVTNPNERGLATQAEQMMNSITGDGSNKKEPVGMIGITEHFMEQFNQLTALSPGVEIAKSGLNKLNDILEKPSPKDEELGSKAPKDNFWKEYIADHINLFEAPGNQVKKILDDFTGIKPEAEMKAEVTNLNSPSDKTLPEKPGNAISQIFKEAMRDTPGLAPNTLGGQEPTKEDYLGELVGNIKDLFAHPEHASNPMVQIMSQWTRESFGLAPNTTKEIDPSKEWLNEDKKDISKEELKDFFVYKMDQGKDLANSLGDNLTAIMEKTVPQEVSDNVFDAIKDDQKIGDALSGDYSKEWEKVEQLFDSGASVKDLNAKIGESASSLPMTVMEQATGFIESALEKGNEMGNEEGPKNPTSGFGIESPGTKGEGDQTPKKPEDTNSPLGSMSPDKEGGGGLEALAGSIARGITYSVARKRGLGPKESGDMAEMAGKEAEEVTKIAASSKDNVGAALSDVKTAKNVAAKGMKAATELIPNPAVGKAIAIGIAIADKASDFVIDLVNNNGNASDKLMDQTSSLSQKNTQKEVESISAAGIGSSQTNGSGGPTSNDFMTLEAFRESIQKDKKGLTKKLVPKEDLLASGAQTAINSVGSWGSGEINKAKQSPKVDEMHKMIDSPA